MLSRGVVLILGKGMWVVITSAPVLLRRDWGGPPSRLSAGKPAGQGFPQYHTVRGRQPSDSEFGTLVPARLQQDINRARNACVRRYSAA